jgi:hypothetical protein
MLIDLKDKIRDSIQESVDNERKKVEEMHKSDLVAKGK